MALDFFLADFLRQINTQVFNQYLESRSLPTITLTDKDEDNVQLMIKVVESDSDKINKTVISELIQVRELSTEGPGSDDVRYLPPSAN